MTVEVFTKKACVAVYYSQYVFCDLEKKLCEVYLPDFEGGLTPYRIGFDRCFNNAEIKKLSLYIN